MDSVLRAGAIYFALLIMLKIAGRRSLGQLTTFDFVLLLIVGEATQQALLGDDFSITNAALVIATLILIDVGMSLIKRRFAFFSYLIDGSPTVVVENGRPLHWKLNKSRVKLEDVMEAARGNGLERLDQIKYAIIECNGKISIIQQPE